MNLLPFQFLVLHLVLAPTAQGGDTNPRYPPPADVKAAFHKLLDRPRVEADLQLKSSEDKAGYEVLTGSFASEKKPNGQVERVPVLIVKPVGLKGAKDKAPAVICLHGTGGNKEGQLALMRELAKSGIIGVAIDARYHGARSGGAKGSAAYLEAITRAWRTKPAEPMEHPFYYDTVYDLWRTVDVLESLPWVDAKNLGMIGFSMGGIETWLAASADERIKVTVPAIGMQSFRWSLDNDKWQGRANTIKAAHVAAARDLGEPEVNAKVCKALWGKVIPGILDQFDGPSMVRLFAGRYLLILNGENDPNCPLGGAKLAFAEAEKAFKEAGTPERLRVMVAAGVGHSVTAEQRKVALEWLVKYLK
jgi:dienelactone hydrolase